MDITRRKFFFFGLAAGVGLMLPDIRIELTKQELGRFQYFNPNGGDLGLGTIPNSFFYGVPYHHSNAGTGTWLGFDRK